MEFHHTLLQMWTATAVNLQLHLFSSPKFHPNNLPTQLSQSPPSPHLDLDNLGMEPNLKVTSKEQCLKCKNSMESIYMISIRIERTARPPSSSHSTARKVTSFMCRCHAQKCLLQIESLPRPRRQHPLHEPVRSHVGSPLLIQTMQDAISLP